MRAGADPPWFSAPAAPSSPPVVSAVPGSGQAPGGSGPGRVAFVLEGGGSYGAAQIGMLHALVDAGLAPEMIVGTSVGAMNGAMLASRTDLRRSLAEMEQMWRGIRRRDVLPVRPTSALRALAGRGSGLVPNDGLGRLIDRWLPVTRLEQLVVPFAAVATDIVSGEPVVLREGVARTALLASSALPGVYPPVHIAGHDLVDGGVVANFPVDVAAGLGATRIYALPTAVSAPSNLSGPFALVQRASDVLVARASRRALESTSGAVWVSEIPAPSTERSMFDFSGSGQLMDDGYESTRRWLAGPAAERVAPVERRRAHGAPSLALG